MQLIQELRALGGLDGAGGQHGTPEAVPSRPWVVLPSEHGHWNHTVQAQI